MTHATITGWGKCLPPAILRNADLATFLETDDEWIVTRTGIRERRISHVRLEELAWVAASLGISYLFEQRPLKLWLINGGYHTLQFTLYGAIIGWLG